jgi:TonB family protein
MVESWRQWEGRIVNGEFPLRQYLGGSDQSAVYLTEIQGARAAIKLISADAPHAQSQIARWELAGRLAHPNLVRILETGLWHADDGQGMLFAVMEYCEESLAGVLRQRPLTPAETRAMLVSALDALNYLHAQDILHGEIRPSSILAVEDQLKLSTDGVHCTDEVEYSHVAGPYDAPEKTTGTISLSRDIWSLGVTLFQALTNRLPVLDQNGDPELTEELPPPFGVIARGCLTLDQERRLSITAIRKLLDRPYVEAKAETKQVAIPEPKAAAKLEAMSSLDDRTEPDGPKSAARSASRHESAEALALAGGKRRVVVISAVVFVILAIAVGLRLARNSLVTPQPDGARVPQLPPTGVTATTRTGGGAAKSTTLTVDSGAVLHEVIPEVSGEARNTINGTVKVKVRVAVDMQGRVLRATIAEGGPSKYFAREALQAARQWTFVTPIHDGKPEASEWTLLFEFRKGGTRATARRTPPA